MASFTRPFDPAEVTRQSEVTLILPDPARAPGDPLIRPGVARYAGATLVLLYVTPSGSSFNLASPVTGTVRNVNLDAPLTGGINQLLEISPLPFDIAPALRALAPGLPTFYVGYSRPADTPPDDEMVNPSAALASVTGDAYVGVIFQDRVALSSWAWIELLRAAMADSGDSAGATAWNSLASLYSGVRSLRVLDHVGRPASRQFQIRIRRTDGTFEGPWTRVAGSDGDLEQAVVANPLPRAGGSQASLFGASGEQTELKWDGDAPTGDTTLPVHAFYESGLSASPADAILLPAGTLRGHLQTLELARWLAPRTAGTSAQLARYRTNSRVEPLIDGIPTFKLLVDDLLASASSGNGAHLAGWAFKDFPLIPGQDDTKLTALTQHIIDGGGDARFLVYKFINFKTDPDTDAKRAAAIALLILTDALLIASALGALGTDAVGYLVVFGGYVLGEVLIPELFSVSSLLEDKAEESKDIFPLLNAIQNNIALWSSHPVRLIDNPVAITPLPLGLDTYMDQFGAWHQKIQLVKRTADDEGNQYVAYLGGIDINGNRMDTPGHQISSPYHDVHARITGPGAADVFKIWDERYAFDRIMVTGSLDPVFPSPAPESLPAQSAKHITQVGRTCFAPNPADASSALPFAPNGDLTTNDTLIRAIKSAREYIYIEDQYFTPNDSDPPGSAETYFDALLAAASTCRRLVILVPGETDQPFGDTRRRFLFKCLQTAWADRVLIGSPVRRPLLPNPGRMTSEGRCILMSDISSTSTVVVIGPKARVPQSVPFWLWIDGELMLSSGLPHPMTVDGVPAMAINVLRGSRGSNPLWGATVHEHQKGAAVTLAQLKGIYVHAKIMMVDDTLVSIGSTNINRRGLFHDGEINIFAVPEQLKSAPDNPARALRTALWAEHLGLPPVMGASLLGDPIAAFELFRRSRYEGNRFTPFIALDLKQYLGFPTGDGLVIQLLSASAIGWADTLIPTLWNDASDPTSYTDPDPTPGPTP